MNAEAYIRQHIRRILLEQEQEPEQKKKSGKIRSVGVGRGRFEFKIKEAGTLAKEDPGQLVKNLGMNKPKGSNDLAKLQDLLKMAAKGTKEMSEVFTMPSSQPKAKNKDGKELESVAVTVSVIPMRNAMKYIEYTLVGATKAYGLKWSSNIEVTQSGQNVVVYLK